MKISRTLIVTHIALNRASFEIPIYMFSAKHFNRMKRIFTALISTVLFSTSAFAQVPANDNCSSAIQLTPTTTGACPTTIYTNINATDAPTGRERNPDCFNGLIAHKDVWFKFKTTAGSNVNYRITITGVNAVDSIKNPQVALYTGDCAATLFKEYCASKDVAAPEGNKIVLDAGCMRQNTDYYIQVADYKSNNTGGKFTICVQPIFNEPYKLTAIPQTTTFCEGTLYDSGDSTGNYLNNERNYTFNIKPVGKGCIEVKVDNFSTQANTDTLTIYNKDGVLLDKISGLTDRPVIFEATTSALKVVFNSDATIAARGFKLTWKTKDFCNAPAPTTCAAPEVIPSLPFAASATNCNDAISTITTSPCPAAANDFLGGKDHIYKFTSAGNQCVRVVLGGIPSTLGLNTINVGLYRNCPSGAGSECVATGRLTTNRDSAIIKNASLSIAGDYYLVVSSRDACTSFNMSMEEVPCLNILPNAGFCDSALPLSGCSNTSPSNVQVDLSVQGDLSFMDFTTPGNSGNKGCILSYGNPPRANFTFLKFKAQANGKFGFLVGSTVPGQIADIDFNVYGPIDNEADICTYAKTRAPARSSWAPANSDTGPGNGSTGLADSYRKPTGELVTVSDDLDCNGSNDVDGIVRRMDVIKDKYYLIWINDYSGVIGRDGVRLDFTGTSDGPLNNGDVNVPFIAGRDTAIFIGSSTPLLAQGGLAYKWTPALGLNQDSIANPVATPSVSTTYNVVIQATCRAVAKKVNVLVFNIKDITNQTVCRNEDLVFNAGEVYPASTGAVWSWSSSTNNLSELSCINCPNPTFKATGAAGAHIFTVTLTTPSRVLSKTFTITVKPEAAPVYSVITSATPTRDTNVCVGSVFNLLKNFEPNATYTWASVPTSALTDNNPSVSPTSSIKYYVSVTGGAGGCTEVSTDSVIVNVFQPPVLKTITDTTLCRDLVISMGKTVVQANTTYSWNNTAGFDNPGAVNPNLTVRPGVETYTLTATNIGGCVTSSTVKVTGIDLQMRIDTPRIVKICRGTPLVLSAIVTLANARVKWSSNRDFTLPLDSTTAKITVTPITRSRYYAEVSLGNCRRIDSADVLVDSLPTNREILPKDTTVCMGAIVLFRSPVFEPIFFPTLKFKWTPTKGQVTADSFYNLVINADTTRTYKRVATSGACMVTDSVKINVDSFPKLVLAPLNAAFCEPASSVIMTVTTPNLKVTGYKWTVNKKEDPSGKDKTTLIPQLMLGVNTIVVQAQIGQCPGSTSTTVTVNPAPPTGFFPIPQVCLNGSTILNNAPNTGLYNYSWTGPGLAVPTTAAAPSVSPTVDNSKYVVKVTNKVTGCTATDSIVIRLITVALADIPTTDICSGNPNPTITAVGTNNLGGAGFYLWSPGGQTTASITPSSSISATYTVVYTFGPNCSVTKTAKVNSLPGFSLRISPDTFSTSKLRDQGDPITLTASGTGNIGTGLTYNWTGGATGTGATISFKANGDAAYTVSATAPSGCKKDTSVRISIRYPNYQLPNAFTPNGDTINGNFGLIFNGSFPPAPTDPRPAFWKGRIEVTSFQVFNRWGQEVYSEATSAVLNAANYKGWNGKKDGKEDGTEQASDVYVYRIKLKMPDDSIKVESGELNLIR